MSLELHVLRSIHDVPEAEWDALLRPESSPFLAHAWLSCLEDAGCVGARKGWLPFHLALRRGGALVAAAPCWVKGSSEGEFVFDWSWADFAERAGVPYYPKLLVAVPFTPATGDRVLVRAGEDRAALVAAVADALRTLTERTDTSGVHALFPREPEVSAWIDVGYMHRLGVQYHWRNRGYRDMADFLSTFNAKRRHALRREMAQPERDGVVIETVPPDAIDAETTAAMYRFYLSTVDKFTWGRRYLNARFFDLVVERFRPRLRWVVAKKDGRPIAGAFNVQDGDRLYGRYWGADVEMPFLHFNVCYYHGIAHCIREGLSVFEPGAGGEHKRPRGFAPTLTHSAHWLRSAKLRAPIEAFLARERDAVRRHVDEETGA
jgi:predicted N-acyltransferase